MKTAIYALSADPITKGHENVVERALRVFDKLIVAIGINETKKPLFDLPERERDTRIALKHFGERVEVKSFDGMLTDFASEQNIKTTIRGARNAADFDYERLLNDINHYQNSGIDTHILITDPKLSYISSTAAKAIVLNGGSNILNFVPVYIKKRLEEKLLKQYRLGITGEIACGKSYVANAFEKMGWVHIDMDKVGHHILEVSEVPMFVELRKRLGETFPGVLKEDGFVNVETLRLYIFREAANTDLFNNMMKEPMLFHLRKLLHISQTKVVVSGALFAEGNFSEICNNHIIMVGCSKDQQLERLKRRGYSEEDIKGRVSSQWSNEEKIRVLQSKIDNHGYGNIYQIDSVNPQTVEKQVKDISDRFYAWDANL